MASWIHNDAEAIYSRMILHNWKNASMKWARRLARKYNNKRPKLPLFDSGDSSLEKGNKRYVC